MADITLVFPKSDMEKSALEFKQDFYNNGEKTINGSYKLDIDKYSYTDWLKIITYNLHKETANSKYGTSDTFFAVNNEQKIVGIITFRHELTDFYKNAGHIGYSVCPSERGKGYGEEMLRQMLSFAKEKGFDNVLLVCRNDNAASQKVILKNGGKAVRAFSEDGIDRKEYCIKL